MGSDQQFCLRWNNFHSNIASSFEDLRDHEDFVDVTLACEGNSLKAHKVVLSACSPYFKNLLKQNPCQHPIIILRDVAFIDLTALLSFVYQGEVYVSQDRLTAFLRTAEMLHIKGLTEQTNQYAASGTIMPVSVGSSSTMILPHTSNNILSEGKATTVTESNVVPSMDVTHVYHLPVHLSPPPTKKRKSSSSTSRSPTPSTPDDVSRHEASYSPLVESGTTFSLRSLADTPVIRSSKPLSPSSPKSNVTRVKRENDTDIKKENEAVNLSIEGSVLRQRFEGYDDCMDGQQMEDCSDALHEDSLDEFQSEHPLSVDDSGDRDKDIVSSPLVIRSPLVGLLPRETSGMYGSAGTSSLTHDTSQDAPARHRWRCMQPRLCPFCWKMFSNSFNLKQHIINVHTVGEGVQCDVCHKIVKNKWYLRKHQVTAHGVPLRRSR